MPVDRIPGQRQVLAHAIELDALDKHLARRHRHDVPAEERLFRVGRCLDLDIARQQADFAAFIHVEGDLAEVHVVQLLVERDRVAADGGNGAPLRLPGIEIRRREDDLVADPPAGGVQDLYRGAACVGRAGQLGPGVRPVTVQVQGSAREHDAAVTHATHDVFALDVVGEGDGRLARVGAGFAADLQLPVHHDPLGGQFQVGVVREAEFAVDRQTAQRRRTDVEHHVLVSSNGDLVACDGHLAVGPGGRIRPVRLPGRRRSGIPGPAATANTLASRNAGRSDATRNERFLLLMSSAPELEKDPSLSAENSAIASPWQEARLAILPHPVGPCRFALFNSGST